MLRIGGPGFLTQALSQRSHRVEAGDGVHFHLPSGFPSVCEFGGLGSLADNTNFWLEFAFSSGEKYGFKGLLGRQGTVGVYSKGEPQIYASGSEFPKIVVWLLSAGESEYAQALMRLGRGLVSWDSDPRQPLTTWWAV